MSAEKKHCIEFLKEVIKSYEDSTKIDDSRVRINLLNEVINQELIFNKPAKSISISKQISSIIKMLKNNNYYTQREHYLKLIEKCCKFSPWTVGYNTKDEYFNNNFGFAELIGPEGLYYSEKISCGFVLMGKNLNYPEHYHPAVEVYEVISGPLEWCINKSNIFLANQGDIIHHKKNELHAMRTHEIPFIGVFTWIGNITAPSVFDKKC